MTDLGIDDLECGGFGQKTRYGTGALMCTCTHVLEVFDHHCQHLEYHFRTCVQRTKMSVIVSFLCNSPNKAVMTILSFIQKVLNWQPLPYPPLLPNEKKHTTKLHSPMKETKNGILWAFIAHLLVSNFNCNWSNLYTTKLDTGGAE